jgi:hypothetical protein
MIIYALGKLWNSSKESLMQRPKNKQTRVSLEVSPNNQVEILQVKILIVSAKDLNIHEKYIETAEP